MNVHESCELPPLSRASCMTPRVKLETLEPPSSWKAPPRLMQASSPHLFQPIPRMTSPLILPKYHPSEMDHFPSSHFSPRAWYPSPTLTCPSPVSPVPFELKEMRWDPTMMAHAQRNPILTPMLLPPPFSQMAVVSPAPTESTIPKTSVISLRSSFTGSQADAPHRDGTMQYSNLTCPHPGCLKSFSRMQNLHSHMSVHSGEKPFACDHLGCEARFRRRQDLFRHVRSIHEPFSARPYGCPSSGCEMRFARADGLAAHAKKCGSKSSLKANRRKKREYAGTSFGEVCAN